MSVDLHRDTAQLTELARGVITREYLIADLNIHAWQTSLAVLLSGLDQDSADEVGLILVPMAPHMKGYWINGIAPGCSFECTLMHRDDTAEFQVIYDKMVAALYPEVEMNDEPKIHKAEPHEHDEQVGVSNCVHCNEVVTRVPGGQGSTWVHTSTGTVAGPGAPREED